MPYNILNIIIQRYVQKREGGILQMKGKNAVKFLIVLVVTGVLTWLTVSGFVVPKYNWNIKGGKDIRTGIDIRGGARITFGTAEGKVPTESELGSVVKVFEKRLDAKKIYDRTIVQEKNNGRVIVELPWKPGETDFNPQKAVDELGKTAMLTFREVDTTKQSSTGGVESNGRIVMEGKDVANAFPSPDQEKGGMHVSLELTSEGAKKFEEGTGRLVGKPIGIFLDEKLISAPIVQEKISGGQARITLGQADSKKSALEARDLADTINAGALPFKLEAKEVTSISPLLGENALNVSLLAGAVSLVLVWIFMLLYYRLPGMLANIALLLHTVIQLLFISWTEITVTLPGIAGIILTIGMGVDANVIIFERVKEELRNGKTLRTAIDVGFKRAFTAIFDANMTTMISAVVLYLFGSGPVQSFAMTLGLGVLLSFVTAVTASRVMLRSVADINIAKHRWLYGA